VLLLSLILLQAAGPSGPAPEAPPCAACVKWEITPAQAEALLSATDPLGGVEVLLRPAADDGNPAALLSALAARGAAVGLIVSRLEDLPRGSSVLRRILIDLDGWKQHDQDRLVFDLKRLATEIRASNPRTEIGLETSPETWDELDKRGTSAYVDFLVGTASLDGARRRGGPPVWIRMTPPCSVDCLALPDDDGRTVRDGRPPAEVPAEGPIEPDAPPHFAAAVEVVGERALTVDEIVARHQAVAAWQRRAVTRTISSGALVVTFEVPGLAAPMTIHSDVVVFEEAGRREIEQRSLRLNGVDYVDDGTGVPRLPLLEPERVTTPPLALTLDAEYRYRLDGRETAEGRDCYVVSFEPAAAGRPQLRGRAWIDARDFALVRAEAFQTGLRGPIVSSQQRDVFAPVAAGDGVAWLLSRSEIHQVYEGPGHRTPIDRVLRLQKIEADPADFGLRRAAAHASRSVIVADTASGLHYLRRAPAASGAAEQEREAAGAATRVRTLALGALVDPNIGRPLPFAGVSWVDFDFLGTGAQVNAFFGGAFAQLAWTIPSLGGSRWQAWGSGLAVLVSYNDRAFSDGLERYEQNLRQRPARLAVGVARPLGGRSRLRVGYELDYTRLGRADTTAAEFVVPVSPVVHGLRVGIELQRGPWSGEAWWNGAVRQRWEPWGFSGAEASEGGFQRFGASAARSIVLSPRAVGRVEAAWMGGRGLDRFSRYSFDGFQNRLRGYPTATLRYDRGAVARSALTWNAAGSVRLDAFLDAARVRDPGVGPRARTYVGAGAGLEAPLPLRALASIEWGYGFQGRGRSGEAGTHVVRVTAYKTF
jgi:hypothetical protein